jgi:pyruvate dehydrogenase E2 component (dihydrolipoamide acetyltransferase)
MTYEFKLPDIGEGVVEGEVVRWLVNEGDRVREDQPLVEIMTDKATVEIPAPRAGRIGKRMYAEGQICPVGKVLITIETDDVVGSETDDVAASPGDDAPGSIAGQSSGTKSVPARIAAAPAVSADQGADESSATPVLATPATRKLARDLGVDIRRVGATGRAGRITSDDVRAHQAGGPAAQHGAPAKASSVPAAASAAATTVGATSTPTESGDVRIPFRGVRKKIAERLVHSKHTAAHFTYVEEIDCTDLVQARAEANRRLADRGVKLSYLPFIIKATVAALQKFPQLNATLDEAASEIVQRRAHHIGLATATDSGLIVPVIRDADGKSLIELGAEIDRLAEATRLGKATREELSGSTFTITSLGLLGGLLATPIINFPEVAILGVHKIAKRPAALGDQIVLRDLMNLSISVDHRVVDGYDAARFVAEIKGHLEKPGSLLIDLA